MRNRYSILAAFLLVAVCASVALATPVPNGAFVKTKIFNDSPMSIAVASNNYPTNIRIQDSDLAGCGYTNRHAWAFSTDGGATPAEFSNNSMFRYAADFNYSGPSDGEGGLCVSPWWSPLTDGQFMCNARTGEVACFGGRLPFYSFTTNYGVHYVEGTTVRLEIIYQPHALTVADPATITFNYITDPWMPSQHVYTSGQLAFDEGNPAEDPPHGLYGLLNTAEVGGYSNMYCECGDDGAKAQVDWSNIVVQTDAATKVKSNTWGGIRQLYK